MKRSEYRMHCLVAALVFNALLPCARAGEAVAEPGSDPTPRALLYLGFGDDEHQDKDKNKVTPKAGAPLAGKVVYTEGKIGPGASIAKGIDGKQSGILKGAKNRIDLRRGSIAFWYRLNTDMLSGPLEMVSIWPGPPKIEITFGVGKKEEVKDKPGNYRALKYHVAFKADFQAHLSSVHVESKTRDMDYDGGTWHHVVFTWSGMRHCVYLDGKLLSTQLASSPFPMTNPNEFRFGLAAGGRQDITVDEFGIYNFEFAEKEVQQAFTATTSEPVKPTGAHGIAVGASWGPCERKVHIAVDSGNDFERECASIAVEALNSKNEVVAKGVIDALRRGFGEIVLPIKELPPETYRARARLLDRSGKVLASGESTTTFELPQTEWVGNTLGITDKIQPPWTPIEVKDRTLNVWGRSHELTGGFGLPQQIVSQGEKLLAKPVELSVISNGAALPIAEKKVDITSSSPASAQWEGSAQAGEVRIGVSGKLEYDGMLLLTLRLSPATAGKAVLLDGINLDTVLPKERAIWANTSTDQGYWWYPYKDNVPSKPGVFVDNVKQQKAQSKFLFYVLFADDDRALEWFADSPKGWQVDEKKPVQELIRDENGDVRLHCLLANKSFTLDKPIEITFGYMATPMKPLPVDWRSAYINHHLLTPWNKGPQIKSDLAVWWIFSGDKDKNRTNAFALSADNPEGFKKNVANVAGIKYAPFTNQHVLVPSPPHNQLEAKGWKYLHGILQQETGNDGWNAIPARGLCDYWAWQVNNFIEQAGIAAIYIDEANTSTYGNNLIAGNGYIAEDGTHAGGHHTLGMREQLKRVRQLFIDHGLRPIVWIPIYAKMIPHAFAFTDIVSEGESFILGNPDGGDWIDTWGKKADNGQPATGRDWLMGIGPAQKYGMIPMFLNEIQYFNHPKYAKASRSMYALLSLLDMLPINTQLGWWFHARMEFGITDPDVRFHRYDTQQTFKTSEPSVRVSYYTAKGRALAVVANLTKQDYSGKLEIDWPKLGLSPEKCKVTNIIGHEELIDDKKKKTPAAPSEKVNLPIEEPGKALAIQVASHDFLMIRIDEPAPAAPAEK